MARHALRGKHLLATSRRIIGRKSIGDGHLRPAVRGGFDAGDGGGLIGPQLGADVRALGMLPYEVERPGGYALTGQRRPRGSVVLDGDPGDASAVGALLD